MGTVTLIGSGMKMLHQVRVVINESFWSEIVIGGPNQQMGKKWEYGVLLSYLNKGDNRIKYYEMCTRDVGHPAVEAVLNIYGDENI